MILSLLVYLITAYFSVGFYHPDEHFQILEFCNYKLGNLPAEKLPWEFREQIRPAIQPFLAFVTIKTLNVFSVFNPYAYALVLRLITAIAAWFIFYKLSLLLIGNFTSETSKKIFLFLILLAGFVPFLSVRFSSENYSALAFLAAIYFIIKYRSFLAEKIIYKLIFTGLLLGFSFFFRFQMAFAMLGLGLWLLIINKTRWENWLLIIASGAAAVLICGLIDFWFYGEFVFTPYKYFYANIIQGKAAGFGVEPWWYYFMSFLNKVNPVFGVVLLLFFIIGLVSRPKDMLVWCIVPFLIAHFILGHKEIRFMFPVIFIFLYLTAAGIGAMVDLLKWQKSSQIIFIFIIVLNIPSITINMFSPADNATACCKYLFDNPLQGNTVLLSRELNTVNRWNTRSYFYDAPGIEKLELKNDTEFNDYLETCEFDTIYVLEKKLIPGRQYTDYANKCVFTPYPDWLLKFNFNEWQSRTTIFNVQELVRIK